MSVLVGLFMITCTGWQLYTYKEALLPASAMSVHPRLFCKMHIRSVFVFVRLCLLRVVVKGVSAFQVYVLKRPHVDEFLQRMGELFECVLFTASLAKVRSPHDIP